MIDIVSLTNGLDMGILSSQSPRAANILSVQLGALEYAQTLGIDLRYFLSDEFEFQNESFKSYLIQVLAKEGIDVASVIETINSLYMQYTFKIKANDSSTSLLVR